MVCINLVLFSNLIILNEVVYHQKPMSLMHLFNHIIRINLNKTSAKITALIVSYPCVILFIGLCLLHHMLNYRIRV